MLCDDPEGWNDRGWREVQEGGDICIHIADSLYCRAAEMNIVKQLSSDLKCKKKFFFLNKQEKLERNDGTAEQAGNLGDVIKTVPSLFEGFPHAASGKESIC